MPQKLRNMCQFYRKRAELTQNEVAEFLASELGRDSYARSKVSMIENGSAIPFLEEAMALARLYDVTPADLFRQEILNLMREKEDQSG